MIDFDPFDHHDCDHEEPKWLVDVADGVSFDLIQLLHYVWHYTLRNRPDMVLGVVGNIGLDLTAVALGLTAEPSEPPVVDKTKALREDVLLDRDAWVEDMRALFAKDKEES